MSFEPLIWAMSLRAEDGLTATTKTVLMALANHCGDRAGGSCFPCQETLARETLFTERTVGNAIRDLADKKFLTIIEKGNGRGKISRYILHVDLTVLARRAEKPNRDAMLIEKVEAVTGRILGDGWKGASDDIKGEPVSIKVERGSDKLPINHPKTTTSIVPVAAAPAHESPGRKSAIKEDWQPTEADIAFAETRNVSCETEVERFRLYHMAKRSLMASWSAAWRTWVLNAVRFGNTRSAAPVMQPSMAAHDPADAYGASAWAKSLPDAKDGTMPYGTVPCILGVDAGGMALDVCTAAGLPSTWRGPLELVADWLRAGFDPDLILSTIRGMKKPSDLKSLRYFDGAVREAQGKAA